MDEDASLDDFLDADDQGAEPEDRETERDGEVAETESRESETDSGDAEPAADRDGGDDEGGPADGEADTAGGEGETPDPEPAVATYDWTPGGAACAACDEVVERRWRDDDAGFVCEACKDW